MQHDNRYVDELLVFGTSLAAAFETMTLRILA
jgi:hypothetical protein